MISSRVDLTENRDFSGGTGRFVLNEVLSQGEFRRVRELDINMSNEDYEMLVKYEKFFGQKRHYTEAIDIFHDEKEWRYNCASVCARCGKPLKPWRIHSDMNLCSDCEEDVDYGGRVPWRDNTRVSFSDQTDDRDILRLR